jgi:hypothetical protein
MPNCTLPLTCKRCGDIDVVVKDFDVSKVRGHGGGDGGFWQQSRGPAVGRKPMRSLIAIIGRLVSAVCTVSRAEPGRTTRSVNPTNRPEGTCPATHSTAQIG